MTSKHSTAEVRTPVTGASLHEFFYELGRIRDESVSEEELKNAKSYLAGVFPIRIETQDGLVDQLVSRSREHMKILPACFVVVGDTVEQAQAKRAKLDSLVDYANAIASLSIALGYDASKFDPDEPLPDNIPESNASKSGRQRAIDLAKPVPIIEPRQRSGTAAVAIIRRAPDHRLHARDHLRIAFGKART